MESDSERLARLRREIAVALEAGDYAAAEPKALAAEALLAMLPDSEKNGDTLTWQREALPALLALIRRKTTAAAGLVVTKVRYATTSR